MIQHTFIPLYIQAYVLSWIHQEMVPWLFQPTLSMAVLHTLVTLGIS